MAKRIFVLILVAVLGSELSMTQWVQQKCGVEEELTDVVMLDSTTAIAVGVDGSILKTTNSGETWIHKEPIIDVFTSWNCVSFCDPLHGIVAGRFLIMTTTNGGEEWIINGITGKGHLISAAYVLPNLIYVGDDSGWVHCSPDSGESWTSDRISAWPIRSLFAHYDIDPMGLPVYALTPYSLCSKTEFPSTPWTEMTLPYFQGLGSEAFNGEFCKLTGLGFIVGVQGDKRSTPAITRLSPPDSEWHVIPVNSLRDGALRGISVPSSRVIYVCGSSGMVFKSTNGGDSWSSSNVPTTRTLSATSFWDEKRGFAVGDSGTILFTNNGGATPVRAKNRESPEEFALSQNYPNPFNPTTTISFDLSSRSFVMLRVFDLVGREIATIVSKELAAGHHSYLWNPEGLSSGVYFYRLQAGSFNTTKKLVLLR